MASSQFVLSNDQPIVALEVKNQFNSLTKGEQLYAHYLSKASFYGGLIVLLQTSSESPQIFRLIHRILIEASKDFSAFKSAVLDLGLSEDDFQAFLIYCAGIYTNMGNYKSFGDTKFIPNFNEIKFEALVKASKAWQKFPIEMEAIWNTCKDAIYSLSDREKQLGLAKNGVTKYLSSNCNQEDVDLINRYLKEKKMDGYLNRLIKTADSVNNVHSYEIRNAGIINSQICREEFEGSSVSVTVGDYQGLLKFVVQFLHQAEENAGNENERSMLSKYIRSFEEGNLDHHKDGSRYWIKNKVPAIETYIGFIETYRDPIGMRGEFEGFVAMVNRLQSRKFQELVNQSKSFIEILPWPQEYEKDAFLRPDFTSLDVLAFSGSSIPIGINIPNYDEIRQSEGFKNVSLGNVIACRSENKSSPFMTNEDHLLIKRLGTKAFELQVGLHELLGHGSGKLFFKKADGTFNFPQNLINPETGSVVDKWYDCGESYDSKFTCLSSAYEECRAECVGLYLCCYPNILRIFIEVEEASDVLYTNWLMLIHSGLKGLEMYSPTTSEWKQAHCQGRFAILQVLLEAKEGFVNLKETSDSLGKDLLLTLDRNKIESVGKPAIGAFLRKLQVFKSTGDVEAAKSLFHCYTDVSPKWEGWREIVLARKVPRLMLVQANTFVKDENIELKTYESTIEGLIQSWIDRFPASEYYGELDAILQGLYEADLPHFGHLAS